MTQKKALKRINAITTLKPLQGTTAFYILTCFSLILFAGESPKYIFIPALLGVSYSIYFVVKFLFKVSGQLRRDEIKLDLPKSHIKFHKWSIALMILILFSYINAIGVAAKVAPEFARTVISATAVFMLSIICIAYTYYIKIVRNLYIINKRK